MYKYHFIKHGMFTVSHITVRHLRHFHQQTAPPFENYVIDLAQTIEFERTPSGELK